MKIICHRGLWKTQKQQNQLDACLKAAKEFDGLEIDLKNRNGQIVLSHDPITSKESPIELVDLLKELKKIKVEPMIAFNIKEDGLGPNLKTIIDRFKCRDYFCFDLSRPEELKYQSIGLKVFQRFGDNDPWQKNHSFSEGLVIDVYSPENLAKILKKLSAKKIRGQLFFISPELHAKEFEAFWTHIKRFHSARDNNIFLCTDCPQKALKFFHE